MRVERADTKLTSRCTVGQTLTIPVKHGEGAWYADDALYEELVALDQIVLRYEDNPNGSLHDVAGVCNREGNVLGLMPHPEHAIDPLLGPADGAFVIASLVDAAREREQALV
jgi:phosphoribosylformylglycinamidine synthase